MESPNPFSREAFLAPTPPPTPSKPPRSPRSKRIMAGAIGVALVGGGASLLVPYLIREHRRNPYATMQNGLILRAIHASDYEPYHKNTDSITYEAHYPTIEIELPRGARLQSVEGRASTGDTVLLGIAGRQTLSTNPLDLIWGDRQSVTINLPQFGVPTSFKWVDVTVEDMEKRRGTWRVYGLPTLQHDVPGDTPLRETQSGPHGITLTARAWRETVPAPRSGSVPYGPIRCEVKATVPASALSGPQQLWAVDIQSVKLEWQPPRSANPFSDEADVARYECLGPLNGPGTFYARATSADESLSPTAQRLARITARLIRYDTPIENVTFHNLPLAAYGKGRKIDVPRDNGSQNTGTILTTPSGIQVKLVRIELESPMSYDFSGSKETAPHDNHNSSDVAVTYGLSLPPNFRAGAQVTRILPAVLAEKNACTDSENGFTDPLPQGKMPSVRVASSRSTYLLGVKNAGQAVLPALTISVARQTEREAIPVTFVVPLGAKPPTEPWDKK